MFSIGNYVFDKKNNERVKIIDKYEVWGFVTYSVFSSETGKMYELPESDITEDAPDFRNNLYYFRYIASIAKIKNETEHGILSGQTKGIIPLPHQLYALKRAVSQEKVRYILADEVGLGKTIEAGLIIRELKARGLVKRVLIVCPAGLVDQWSIEMQEKFNTTFDIIYPDEYDTIRKITKKDDVYGQFENVISPMDSIKPLESRKGWSDEKVAEYNEERIYSIISSGWDMIIIDEAHRVAGSSGTVARYLLGKLLSEASPYLLLLTATPHNGKTEPFLRLVRLIDENLFPNESALIKDMVSPYIIRTEKREAIDNNGNKLFKNRTTHEISITWDERHTMQRKLYEQVTKYVSENYNKAMRNRGKNMCFIFLLIIMQRMVASSTSAVRQSLEKRIKILENTDFMLENMSVDDFENIDSEESFEKVIAAMSFDIKEEKKEIYEIIATAKQAEFQYPDAKTEPLLKIVNELIYNNSERKIIIFTEFVATQDYIYRILSEQGYKISRLNGSMSIEERNNVIDEFESKTDILISTDAGGEGLNLQFSDCVINYDLPWNPMKIEQRIGRVDRIGQKNDVEVYNFIIDDTIESRVRKVITEKLKIILKDIGVDKYSDILDSETAGVNFTNAYMKSIKNPKNIEFNAKSVEDDVRSEVKNALEYKELLQSTKDLVSLTGAESTFDIEKALGNMMIFFALANGKDIDISKKYKITDESVTQHLKKVFECDYKSAVPIIKASEFNFESGYFMICKLSVASDGSECCFVPVFITDNGVSRKFTAGKIFDMLTNTDTKMLSIEETNLLREEYMRIIEKARESEYDTFLDMKSEYEIRTEENYNKYLYASKLKLEAAGKIGIENIRKAKIASIENDIDSAKKRYESLKRICPVFTPEFMIRFR